LAEQERIAYVCHRPEVDWRVAALDNQYETLVVRSEGDLAGSLMVARWGSEVQVECPERRRDELETQRRTICEASDTDIGSCVGYAYRTSIYYKRGGKNEMSHLL